MDIKVLYTTVDRVRIERRFVTLRGARKWAVSMIGQYPEMGVGYAICGDGIGKIQCSGCTLTELFTDPLDEAFKAWYVSLPQRLCEGNYDALRTGFKAGYKAASERS